MMPISELPLGIFTAEVGCDEVAPSALAAAAHHGNFVVANETSSNASNGAKFSRQKVRPSVSSITQATGGLSSYQSFMEKFGNAGFEGAEKGANKTLPSANFMTNLQGKFTWRHLHLQITTIRIYVFIYVGAVYILQKNLWGYFLQEIVELWRGELNEARPVPHTVPRPITVSGRQTNYGFQKVSFAVIAGGKNGHNFANPDEESCAGFCAVNSPCCMATSNFPRVAR